MPKICPNCQTIQTQHQLTCRRCGKYVSEQDASTAVPPANPMLVVVVIIVLLGGGGYGGYLYMQSQQKAKQAEVAPTAIPTPVKTADATAQQTTAKKSKKRRRQH